MLNEGGPAVPWQLLSPEKRLAGTICSTNLFSPPPSPGVGMARSEHNSHLSSPSLSMRLSSIGRLSFALPLLLFTACDTTTEAPGTDGTFDEGCEQETAIQIDPTGTYLRTSNDESRSPTSLRLADFGIAPGDRVTLQRFGEYQYMGRGDRTLVREQLVGVFSSSNELLAREQHPRVSGALDAGSDFVTPLSFSGQLSTDITQDFLVDNTTVTVPAGAAFLLVSPSDDLFEDNIDEDEDYRICVTEG